MTNPFKKARKDLGITMTELCFLTGLSMTAIYNLEKGITKEPPEKALDFFRKKGFNPEQLKDEYQAFLQQIREV